MTYEQRHAKRFRLSLEALRPHLRAGMAVLECGGVGAFTQTVQTEFGVRVSDTKWDLRYPRPDEAAEMFDAVLCMEVFEHLHDQEPAGHEWRGTGAACLLAHCHRALKPGGLLFLTTPNACSLHVLFNVLTHRPPMVYRPHVREYGPHELAQLVHAAGFTVLGVVSHDCWDNDCMSRTEEETLRGAIARLGYPSDCRGEDLFLTATKP